MHRKPVCGWAQRSLYVLSLMLCRCEPSVQRSHLGIAVATRVTMSPNNWLLNCFWLQASNCGQDAVTLLTKLLEINPSKRPRAQQLLTHNDVLGRVTPPISVF
jgi:hypothetical protein